MRGETTESILILRGSNRIQKDVGDPEDETLRFKKVRRVMPKCHSIQQITPSDITIWLSLPAGRQCLRLQLPLADFCPVWPTQSQRIWGYHKETHSLSTQNGLRRAIQPDYRPSARGKEQTPQS